MNIDDVYGLERHRYAPEMNKLHMNDATAYLKYTLK